MNNNSLKSERWVWTSFVSGMIFLSFLSGNILCAEDSTEEVAKHIAYSPPHGKPLTKDDALSFMSVLPFEVKTHIVSMLPKAEQCHYRSLSKRYRNSIDLFFFGPVYDPHSSIDAFSSELSPGRIGENIFNILKNARFRVIVASDKCTNEEFLDDLLSLRGNEGQPLEIRIVTGEDRQTQALLGNPKYLGTIVHQSIASNHNRSGKMHNKFIIVDDELIITGSPNLTYAAYNYNVESFVAIQHRFIARLYFRYYEYIISGKDKYDSTQDEYQRVRKMMQVFNGAPNNRLQVCLAPILDIKSFVVHELNTSQAININMFLISRTTPDTQEDDIIAHLLNAADQGAEITIKVDGEHYRDSRYMRPALNPLILIGQSIYTVVKRPTKMKTRTKKITTIPQFHDKLILIKNRDDSTSVLIGSAGFTDNVQDNLNLENMVLIRIPRIYELLLGHFISINSDRGNLVVTKLSEFN